MPSQIAVAQFKRIASTMRREEDGQDLLEYALLCGLIAIVAYWRCDDGRKHDPHGVLAGHCQHLLTRRLWSYPPGC